jgi:hypothetical protein
LHAGLMARLRSESGDQPEPTRWPFWFEALESWISSPRGAWGLVAAGVTAVLVLLAVQWIGTGKGVAPSGRATIASNGGAPSVQRAETEPASPAEFRRALVSSLEDFEIALRRNDHLLATREPIATPLREVSTEIR